MINGFLGHAVKAVSKGHGSFLTIKFEPNEPSEAGSEASLWLYLCRWNLSKKGQALADETNVSPETDFEFMNGIVLESFEFTSDEQAFNLYFSDSVTLRVTPDLSEYEGEDDLIRITDYAGKTQGYSPSLGWSQ